MAGRAGKARAFAFLIYPDSWTTWENGASEGASHAPSNSPRLLVTVTNDQ